MVRLVEGQETKGMFAQGQDDEYLSYWDISGSPVMSCNIHLKGSH